MPSNAPAAAFWLYNPSIPRTSLDHREELQRQLLEYFYSLSPPEDVAVWRAEAAGRAPSEALVLLSNHFDEWIRPRR
jgi:hypothetical protein